MIRRAATDVKPARVIPYRGSGARVTTDRCTEAAAPPSTYCAVHKSMVEEKLSEVSGSALNDGAPL